MGVLATTKVITSSNRASRPFFTQLGNREWVTIIKSINARRWALLGMTIFKGKVHLLTWYEETELPSN